MSNKREMIETENLYCAELCICKLYEENGKNYLKAISLNPRKFVLVKKSGSVDYTDIFTNSEYRLFSYAFNTTGMIVLANMTPACTTKQFISFDEAIQIFNILNPDNVIKENTENNSRSKVFVKRFKDRFKKDNK